MVGRARVAEVRPHAPVGEGAAKLVVGLQRQLINALVEGQPLLQILVGPLNASEFAGMLDSPYDWRSLCIAAKGMLHLGSGQSSPKQRAVDGFKSQLGNWGANEVASWAAKPNPDVDRVFFALRMKGFGKLRQHGLGPCNREALWCEGACSALAAMIPLEHDPFLRMIAAIDDRFARIVDLGGLEAVLTAMEQFPDAVAVQEQGCRVLAALAEAVQIPDKAEQTCVVAILSAMDCHPGSVLLQEMGCRAVSHLDVEQCFVPAGGIRAILRAMKNHPNAASVQAEACEALASLVRLQYGRCKNCMEHCKQIRLLGGLQVIFEAMQKHSEEPKVQQYACIAICSMLEIDAGGLQFAVAGGVVAIVRTIERYRRAFALEPVLAWAMQVLQFWSVGDEAIDKLSDNDVQIVLDALGEHPEPSVGEHAARTLGNLSRARRWSKFIVQRGGFGLIVKTMEAHEFRESLQEGGCFALGRLVKEEPSNFMRGARVILKAMGNHIGSVELQLHSLMFMESSMNRAGGVAVIGALGGCEAVLKAMQEHAECSQLQVQALRALRALIEHDENKCKLAALSSLTDTLMEAMEDHHKVEEVRELGRHILRTLSASSEARVHSVTLRALSLFL